MSNICNDLNGFVFQKAASRIEQGSWRRGPAPSYEGPHSVLSERQEFPIDAWFREDTEVIDFFAPPREDFLVGVKPAYMSEG